MPDIEHMVNNAFEAHQRDRHNERQALIDRMATSIVNRHHIALGAAAHIKEIIKMTYDTGLIDGIEFALGEEKEENDA